MTTTSSATPDWGRLDAVKKRILQGIATATPPGGAQICLDDPVQYKAAEQLLKEHAGGITAFKSQGRFGTERRPTMTLVRTTHFGQCMSDDDADYLRKHGFVVDASNVDTFAADLDLQLAAEVLTGAPLRSADDVK